MPLTREAFRLQLLQCDGVLCECGVVRGEVLTVGVLSVVECVECGLSGLECFFGGVESFEDGLLLDDGCADG